MTPSRLAHYEILEKIGQGGMGVVLKAHDTRLERIVALKILPALASTDEERRHRFLREAQAEARLNHPSIATVYEIGEAEIDDPELAPPTPGGQVPYIAMEYIEGRDLQELIAEDRPDPKTILSIAIQIAEALEAAHAQGVVHRDLKPHNIRVTPEGRVKLLDFGLAKLLTAKGSEGLARPTGQTFLTTEGMIVGTIPYIAPEQIEGTLSEPRSDLFAFGVVLYQLATGELPFDSSSLVSFVRSVTDDRPRRVTETNPAVHPRLDPLVARLLEPEPDDRFQTAREVAAELKRIARGATPTAPYALRGLLRPLARMRNRRRVAAAVVIAAAVAAAWIWTLGRPGQAPGVATVALLPFANQTGDPTLDRTAHALQSLVGNRVAQLAALVETRRTGALANEGLSDVEIARTVGADYALRGEFQRLDETPILQVDLSEASSALQLWRLSFERYDLREELLWRIEDYLRVLVSPRQARRRARNPAEAARTLNLYFDARQRLDRGGEREELLATVEAFRAVTRSDAESPAAWTGLSAAAWQLYEHTRESTVLEEAVTAADRALALDPGNVGARIARARVARARESLDTSIARFEAILADAATLSEGERAEIHYQLSVGLEQNRQPAEAISYLELALRMRPEFWRWWHQLGVYRAAENDFERAFDALERSIELAPPGVTRSLDALVTTSLQAGRPQAALEQCRAIEQSAPLTNAFTLSNCGTAYFFAGDCGRAAEYYAKTVAQVPGQATGWANLGDARECLGQPTAAAEAYGRAVDVLEEKRRDATLLLAERNRLPLYLAKADRCEGASGGSAAAAELLAADPESPEAARLAAQTLALCGQREAALAAVERALELGVPASTLRSAVEFADYADDPAFRRLLDPPG